MTYQQTIDYLYSQLPMFSRIGSAAYKADLHNTIAICSSIDNPQNKFKSIHIAGTNGKGSTSHTLAAILQSAGYKTGLYTSPHIHDFRERIRINGEIIPEQTVIDFVTKTAAITKETSPSFFELTVAMAFDYFAEQKIDYAIIETGLGGLLDSTNVITPILSIITNIGYDHQHILGHTLQEIALQKAGIIKDYVPVVIGETLPETKQIFIDKAVEKNTKIIFAEENFICTKAIVENNNLVCNIQNIHNKSSIACTFGLAGLYQTKNICTILAAIYQLQKIGVTVTANALQQGLANVKTLTGIKGRWDVLQNNPTIIADVAHNKDGISQIVQQLNSNYPNTNTHFIIGFVNDKDVNSVLTLFPKNAKYYFTNAHIPRAMPMQLLKEKAQKAGLEGNCFDDVNTALIAAKQNATKTDVIMVCGSFFTIAELKLIQ